MDGSKVFRSVNEIYEIVGDGKYQFLCICVLCLAVMPITMQQYIMILLAIPPPWKMTNSTDIIYPRESAYNDKCKLYKEQWAWSEEKGYSVISEFNLDCDQESLVHLTIMLYFGFTMVGSFFWGYMADRVGRKNVLLIGTLLNISAALVTAFARNAAMFVAIRSVNGFCTGSLLMTMAVYGAEIVSADKRTYGSMGAWIFYTLGTVLLGGIAYGINNWRHLLWCSSVPFYVVVVLLWFLPESIAWEFNKNKTDRVKKKIYSMCKVNGRKTPDLDGLKLQGENNQQAPKLKNFILLWKQRKMSLITIMLAFAWMFLGCGYMGLAYAATNLTGNTKRDFLLSRCSECISLVIAFYSSPRFGRKKTCTISTFLGGVFLIAVGCTPDNSSKNYKVLRAILGVVGNFFTAITYDVIFSWTSEIYPTFLRSTASGFHLSCSYIGMMLAPWVALWLDRYNTALPFYCMGGLLIFSSLLQLNINETLGKELVETLEENKSFQKEIVNSK